MGLLGKIGKSVGGMMGRGGATDADMARTFGGQFQDELMGLMQQAGSGRYADQHQFIAALTQLGNKAEMGGDATTANMIKQMVERQMGMMQ